MHPILDGPLHPCLSKPMSMITVIGIKFTWKAWIDTIFIIFVYSHIVITLVIVSYDSFQISIAGVDKKKLLQWYYRLVPCYGGAPFLIIG